MKKFKIIIMMLMFALVLPFSVNADETYAFSKFLDLEIAYFPQFPEINLGIVALDEEKVTEENLDKNIKVDYYTIDDNGSKNIYYHLDKSLGYGGTGDVDRLSYDYSYRFIGELPEITNSYADIYINFEDINYIAKLTVNFNEVEIKNGLIVGGVTEVLDPIMVDKFVPDTLTLSIKESEFTHKNIGGEVDRAMEKYLKDNEYDLNSLGLHYTTWYGEDYGESSFYTTYMVNICNDKDQCFLDPGKSVKLTYSNSSDRNDADATYVKNAIKDKDFVLYTPNRFDEKVFGSILEEDISRLEKYVEDLINDKSIKAYINVEGSKGDGWVGYIDLSAWVFLYKNDVFYEKIYASEVSTYEIEVPYETKEEDYLTVVSPLLDTYIKKMSNNEFNEKIISIKKVGQTSQYIPNAKGDTFYELGTDGEYESFVVSIVKAEKNIPITSVSTNKTSLSLVTGKSEKLIATINPSDTTDSKILTWTSSNTKVATVDGAGNVKAIAAGTAIITVKTSNGKTATVKVTVTNPVVAITSVKINQSSPIIAIGKTAKLTAAINPSNTTQSKTLTWSSSNTKVATVDKNGTVKGIKAGTATITVKTSNGKTASVKVTVKKATPIKSVKLNKSSAKLELNKTLQLKATINPSGTTDSKTLTWTSSNKKVATVDKNGKVTAISAGTAKITVKTSNGKKATVKITVSKINAKNAKIASIKNQTQTGKALKPSVTVTLNGKILKSGTDYTVTYKNNKNAGKATVTVKFKGNYTGSKTATFLIIPSKVSIKNPTSAKKTITVKYSKVSGAKTYQIAYRLKGTTKWSYTTSTSASKKISKLTSGKEYEVCVRAGIKSGSKTLYGAWSATKTVKVK